MSRILLTGAAGRLGKDLWTRYASQGRDVLATDIVQPDDTPPLALADLSDRAQVDTLMAQDVSTVVHFAGIPVEARWQEILESNIIAAYNIFESARKSGVKRIIFASTYHVIGMYPVAETPIGIGALPRPDTLYGVSKLFGENLARLYFDKFGIECMCIRICTALGPKTERELHLYCNRDDLAELILAAIDAPELGYKLVYGISEIDGAWCANNPDQRLDWLPRHSSAELTPPDGDVWAPMAPDLTTVGGVFSTWGHRDDD